MSTVRIYKHQVQTPKLVEKNTVSSKFIEKQLNSQKREKINSLIVNSILVGLALFLSVQFIRGTVMNLDRYLTLNTKMASLQELNTKANYQNEVLKKKFQSYNSPEGLEGLARDYLNLVGENEISIILTKS